MNVTPLRKDRTAAARSRRYRQRKRDAAKAGIATPTVARPRRDGVVARGVTLMAALGVAAVSAGFSVVGLTHVFSGAFLPVVGMGVALECAKLCGVAWLGRNRRTGAHGVAMMALVGVLMALNATGAFGYLSSAHVAKAASGEAAIDSRAAEVEAHRKVQAAAVADLDRRIAQVDASVDEAIRRGRTTAAMALADQQRRNRADLVLERGRAAEKLAALEVEAAGIENDRAQLAADDGPILYVAAFVGARPDDVTRWFVLLVAALLDPAAVLLLLAATARGES